MKRGNPVKTITLTNTRVCAYTDGQEPRYVFYTGSIAGISDRTAESKAGSEPFDRGSDKVELERDFVKRTPLAF